MTTGHCWKHRFRRERLWFQKWTNSLSQLVDLKQSQSMEGVCMRERNHIKQCIMKKSKTQTHVHQKSPKSFSKGKKAKQTWGRHKKPWMTRSRIMQPGHRQSRMARSSVYIRLWYHSHSALFFLKGVRSQSGVSLWIGKHTFKVTERSLQSCCSSVPKWWIRNSKFGREIKVDGNIFSLNFNEGYLMCFGVHSTDNCIDFRVTPSSGKCLPNQNFREIHPLQCMTW